MTRAMHARPGHHYPAGRTGRYGPTYLDPIRHAMTSVPAARVRDTGTRLALCGATLQGRIIIPGVPGMLVFDFGHRRACRECARAVKEANPSWV